MSQSVGVSCGETCPFLSGLLCETQMIHLYSLDFSLSYDLLLVQAI